MRIELTKADDGKSLHSGRPELWVRVLSGDALGPQDFSEKILPEVRADVAGYSTIPVQFYSDLIGAWEDEPVQSNGLKFESWYILTKKGLET